MQKFYKGAIEKVPNNPQKIWDIGFIVLFQKYSVFRVPKQDVGNIQIEILFKRRSRKLIFRWVILEK